MCVIVNFSAPYRFLISCVSSCDKVSTLVNQKINLN